MAICVIIWAICGCWASYVMEKKNRSPIAGLALGVLLGIIGVIICYCFDDKPTFKNN